MKIALIRGPYLRPNGVLPWEYLHNHYDDVQITAFESDPPRFDTSLLNIPVKKLHWLDGKIDFFGSDYIIWKGLAKLKLPKAVILGIKKIIEEYDVIHTSENFNFFSLQGALWSSIKDKIFVFSAGENIPFYPNNILTWKVKKFVNRSASAITTTTEESKKALVKEGVSPEKITVIPNALNFNYFDKGPKDGSKVNLPKEIENTFNILFVHGLKKQKGVPYLLKAFKKLSKVKSDLRLILVGKNRLNDKYYLKHIKKDPKIYHIEYIPNTEIRYLYNLSDIFILPSITMPGNREQFGMAVLEAMACGVPSIVTNVGGLPYVVEENKTSLIINERSSKEIREAIENLYEDKKLRKRLGDFSYNYVRRKFSKEVIGKKLYNFYKKIGC